VPASLSGTVSNVTGSLWRQVSGPGVATFGDATQPATTVNFSASGYYVLALTASNQFAQVSDSMTVFAAGNYPPSARYQALITFTNYNRAEVLTNFPVLAVLGTNVSGFDYGSFLSPTGADLRFTTVDGVTPLNYEVEQWNPAGNSFFWVQVPQFSNGVSILAKWRDPANASPFPSTTNGATWSGGFLGVWHLTETNGPHYDSAFNYPTSRWTSVAQQGTAEGIASGCDNFLAAQSNHVSLPDLGTQSAVTVECWANLNGTPGGADIGLVSSDPWSAGITHFKVNSSFQVKAGTYNSGSVLSPANLVVSGDWFHAAYSVTDAGTNGLKLYVNGALIGSAAGATNNNLTDVNLAREYNGRYLNGRLDEVRISSVARSSNWLWATWLNVASNAAFSSYSTVQVLPSPLPQIDSVEFTGGQLQFQVSGPPGWNYTVQASTNLLAWTNVFTTNMSTLPFSWTNTEMQMPGQQFYRVLVFP
jgi:hypothetical protein